jgi:signal transduction histidine kinase
MSADELVQYLSWLVFGLLFGITVVRAVRRPRRVHFDIALLFSIPAVVILLGLLALAGFVQAGPIPNAINTSLLLALGYLLVRLGDDFAHVPAWLLRGSELLLALLALSAFVLPPPRPAAITLVMFVYLIGLLAYSTVTFVRTARRASGVTRRRISAVAGGALLLALLFCLAFVRPLAPAASGMVWQILQDLAGLASGVCFFLGFAPPAWLRRAWQEPELRAFLGRAARLPRLPSTEMIVAELEQGAQAALGASGATIGLWEPSEGVLRFSIDSTFRLDTNAPSPGALAFRDQRQVFSDNVRRDYPAYAERSQRVGASAVLVAPITAGAQRLGVLTVYAPRAPIFAEDDLALVQLLADQAAVILESRALIDEAVRVQAREAAARLKEDFLSAAAHDLKTPLTTVVARAQFLERRAVRAPDAPADLASIQQLVQESQRLRRLVLELLDAARAERGLLVGAREPTDLADLARRVCERQGSAGHPCVVEADSQVVGAYDMVRIEQLLDNLVENAIKYSPEGSQVCVAVWPQGEEAMLTVSDAGIGIPAEDLPQIFERFYRASNVDDRRFPGMGLGLYICHAIVEQHGGRIWVTSQPGQGTTFHVVLPSVSMRVDDYAA